MASQKLHQHGHGDYGLTFIRVTPRKIELKVFDMVYDRQHKHVWVEGTYLGILGNDKRSHSALYFDERVALAYQFVKEQGAAGAFVLESREASDQFGNCQHQVLADNQTFMSPFRGIYRPKKILDTLASGSTQDRNKLMDWNSVPDAADCKAVANEPPIGTSQIHLQLPEIKSPRMSDHDRDRDAKEVVCLECKSTTACVVLVPCRHFVWCKLCLDTILASNKDKNNRCPMILCLREFNAAFHIKPVQLSLPVSSSR